MLKDIIKSLSDTEIVAISTELATGVDLEGILSQLNGKSNDFNLKSLNSTELSNILLIELSERLLTVDSEK
jgi:hypothetical protein